MAMLPLLRITLKLNPKVVFPFQEIETFFIFFVKSKNNFVIGDEEGWQLWDTIDTNRTKASVQGLQKGKEYQFRIIAINKAGKSDPSHSSRGREALPRSRKNNVITAVWLHIFRLQY